MKLGIEQMKTLNLTRLEFEEVLKSNNFVFRKAAIGLKVSYKVFMQQFIVHNLTYEDFNKLVRKNIKLEILKSGSNRLKNLLKCSVCKREFGCSSEDVRYCSVTCRGIERRKTAVLEVWEEAAIGIQQVTEAGCVAALRQNQINYLKVSKMFGLSANGLRWKVKSWGFDVKTLEKV